MSGKGTQGWRPCVTYGMRHAILGKWYSHYIDHIIYLKKTLDIYDENILRAYGMGFELDIESSNFCEILDLHGHVIPEFYRNQRVYRRASVYYSDDWI